MSEIEDYIQIRSYPVQTALRILLEDKTTKQNIIWATSSYEAYGSEYAGRNQMTMEALTGLNPILLQPRIRKAAAQQQERTQKHAEVFTPAWVCNLMNNFCDEEWFGKKDVFNQRSDNTWITAEEPVAFPEGKTWKDYVKATRLEITCGEAPFIVSRYDASTGEAIAIEDRIGLLDRKLRVVEENTSARRSWWYWVVKAYQSVYGYEYQGDNLLICRINLLMTFVEHYRKRFEKEPSEQLIERIANIIAWNFWQMDGLTCAVPLGVPEEQHQQLSLFDSLPELDGTEEAAAAPRCRIYDWDADQSLLFEDLKNRGANSSKETCTMKFDYVIGNPPYQEETTGDNESFAPPVYHKFLDAAFDIGDVVETIHPARFLFNAGNTPKSWNEKMLSDPHYKVLYYEQDSGKVFPNTYITGGVAISYHDNKSNFGMIETFTAYQQLNSIMQKASPKTEENSIISILYNQTRFDLEALYKDYPEMAMSIGSSGKDRRFRNNIFEKIPLFTKEPTFNDDIRVLGIINSKREWRFFPKKYADITHNNLWKYKAMLSSANGASGTLGSEAARITTVPFIGEPNEGYTQTFISFGAFPSKEDAVSCVKYLKTRFTRVMLGILKVTQDNKKGTWRYVPLQDFTPASDIDWSQSIRNIDQQLYKKYGLTKEEIDFIETHVQEMS